jgi:hypothetical protein
LRSDDNDHFERTEAVSENVVSETERVARIKS